MGSVTDIVSIQRDKAGLLRERRDVYVGWDAWDKLPMSWVDAHTRTTGGIHESA